MFHLLRPFYSWRKSMHWIVKNKLISKLGDHWDKMDSLSVLGYDKEGLSIYWEGETHLPLVMITKRVGKYHETLLEQVRGTKGVREIPPKNQSCNCQ